MKTFNRLILIVTVLMTVCNSCSTLCYFKPPRTVTNTRTEYITFGYPKKSQHTSVRIFEFREESKASNREQ